MKKIFLLFAAVCVLFACDPTHEKIDNGGHITLEELLAKTTVKTDIAPSGANGNVILCETLAPVNAFWTIDDKEFNSNSARQKMKLGEHSVKLIALCPDGTTLEKEWIGILCEEITDPLTKYYIYGDPANPDQKPAVLKLDQNAAGGWDPNGAYGRFSDGEGYYFPYITDDVYNGLKTLIYDVIDLQDGEGCWGSGYGAPRMRIMSGWWNGPYCDDFEPHLGLNEFTITPECAEDCALGKTAHDLDFMCLRGTITIKSVYYEE